MHVLHKFIEITFQFEGWHRWPGAPDEHAYLREYHRHMFHVEMRKEVSESDRQIEFIKFKKEVEDYAKENIGGWENRSNNSCEKMAEALLYSFDASGVRVREDGENGALIIRSNFNGGQKQPAKVGGPAPTDDAKDWIEMDNDFYKEVRKEMEGYAEGLKRYIVLKGMGVQPVKREEAFFGIEAEGPYQNERTMFVPSSGKTFLTIYPLMRKFVNNYIVSEIGINLYFGAGNYPVKSYHTLWTLMKSLQRATGRILKQDEIDPRLFGHSTIEITSIQDLKDSMQTFAPSDEEKYLYNFLQNFNVVLSNDPKDMDNNYVDFIKMVNDTHVSWICTNSENNLERAFNHFTRLDDPRYKTDQTIVFSEDELKS